jgi:protoheme IX farnesyltransferase
MITKDVVKSSSGGLILNKIKAYVQLLKLRLSMLVALSAVFGYAMAGGTDSSVLSLLLIGLGGLLITGASNVLNQVFEKKYDSLMNRTSQRPMPLGQVSDLEGVAYALVVAVIGIAMLGYFFNLSAALLGIIGLLSYAFVYTPMKRISPFSVFIGAIPGGLPPLIGYVAFTGYIDMYGLILFAFQFFWQFPHFWAIAWRLDEDYQRAGFKMLPSSTGRSSYSALMITIYTLSMVPLALFPWSTGMVNGWIAIGLALAGVAFSIPAIRLQRSLDMKFAKQLMFASFLYLPVIQVLFLLG